MSSKVSQGQRRGDEVTFFIQLHEGLVGKLPAPLYRAAQHVQVRDNVLKCFVTGRPREIAVVLETAAPERHHVILQGVLVELRSHGLHRGSTTDPLRFLLRRTRR